MCYILFLWLFFCTDHLIKKIVFSKKEEVILATNEVVPFVLRVSKLYTTDGEEMTLVLALWFSLFISLLKYDLFHNKTVESYLPKVLYSVFSG